MSLLFFGLALIAALLALHPFVTYPLSLRLILAFRGRTVLNVSEPVPSSATIMISARNEAAVIGPKLRSVQDAVRSVEGVEIEILLFADGCTDQTADIARSAIGDHNVIDGGVTAVGKTEAMNALACRAKGEILVLTDANSMLDVRALSGLLLRFQDPMVGVVLGSSIIVLDDGKTGGLSELLAGYWRFVENLRTLETDVGSTIGGDGALYGVRAALWPYPAPDIIDDFYVPMAALLSGHRVVFAPDATIREASVKGLKDEGPRKYRIAARVLRAHRAFREDLPKLDILHRYMYVSHKVLKWMIGLSTLLSAIFAALGLAFAGYGEVSIAAVLTFAALLFVGARHPQFQPAGKIFNAFVAVVQFTRGAMFGLSGGSITSWTPPVSDRRVPK